jgi:hypothetical protein
LQFAQRINQCDNSFMQKYFAFTVPASVGMLLLFSIWSQAQQTPPTSNATNPPAKSRPATAAKSSTVLSLKTQKDKFSYALGMNLGKNLHQQAVAVDPNILARGLKDALTGGKTLLTDDEARAALTAAQAEVRAKQQEKMQQAGAENKKEGETFLAANKAKDGVVTLPSGLQYKILTAGTGPKPTASDTVVCNYRGTLLQAGPARDFPGGRRHQGMDRSPSAHACRIQVAAIHSDGPRLRRSRRGRGHRPWRHPDF